MQNHLVGVASEESRWDVKLYVFAKQLMHGLHIQMLKVEVDFTTKRR